MLIFRSGFTLERKTCVASVAHLAEMATVARVARVRPRIL
jgi:hypothetical protein